MSTYGPLIAIALALVAAGSVAVIAWELTSKDFHDSLEDQSEAEAESQPKDD